MVCENLTKVLKALVSATNLPILEVTEDERYVLSTDVLQNPDIEMNNQRIKKRRPKSKKTKKMIKIEEIDKGKLPGYTPKQNIFRSKIKKMRDRMIKNEREN